MKVRKLGNVWTATAKLYDDHGQLIAKCIDTPNAIAAALIDYPRATSVKTIDEHKPRDAYADRIAMLKNHPAWKEALTRQATT